MEQLGWEELTRLGQTGDKKSIPWTDQSDPGGSKLISEETDDGGKYAEKRREHRRDGEVTS